MKNLALFLFLCLTVVSGCQEPFTPQPKPENPHKLGILNLAVRLYSDSGAPADSLKITISRSLADAENGISYVDLMTGKDGNTKFIAEPGMYYCLINCEIDGKKMTNVLDRVKYPDSSKANGPLIIDLKPGDTSITTVLDEEMGLPGGLIHPLTVTTKIGSSSPKDAIVGLFKSPAKAHIGLSEAVATQYADENGVARFASLGVGSYYVVAYAGKKITGYLYTSDTTKIAGYHTGALPKGPQKVFLNGIGNVSITTYLGVAR
jgi:hypothetical protein